MTIKLLTESKNIIREVYYDNLHKIDICDKIKIWYEIMINVPLVDIEIKESLKKKRNISFIQYLLDIDLTYYIKINIPHYEEFKNAIDNNCKKSMKKWFIKNHTNFSILDIIDVNYLYNKEDNNYLEKLMYNNPFTPLNVIEYLENTDLIKRKVNYNGITIQCFEKEKKINLQEIIRIIEILRNISKNYKNILIIIGLTPFKKKSFNNELGPISINSGSSYKNNYINIWRYEEIHKVLIHELIHFLDLDLIDRNKNKIIENDIKKLIDITGVCNPSESYTESVSVIIHTLYICSLKNNLLLYPKLLNCEINFSIRQCKKILKILNIKSYKKIKIHQTTSIVCYFFIKTAILLNYKYFINFISNDINFKDKYDDYKDIIKKSFYLLNIIDNAPLLTKYNGLRMTAIQITKV